MWPQVHTRRWAATALPATYAPPTAATTALMATLKILNWRRCEKPEVDRRLAAFAVRTREGFTFAGCSLILGHDGQPVFRLPDAVSIDPARKVQFEDAVFGALRKRGFTASLVYSSALLGGNGLRIHL